MSRRKIVLPCLAALAVALAGCSASREDRAVAACVKGAAAKIEGEQSYEIDQQELLANAKAGEGGTLELEGTIYFDRGLPAEKKQRLECRVQFDAANDAAEPVAYVQFIW